MREDRARSVRLMEIKRMLVAEPRLCRKYEIQRELRVVPSRNSPAESTPFAVK